MESRSPKGLTGFFCFVAVVIDQWKKGIKLKSWIKSKSWGVICKKSVLLVVNKE
jgi:hypothetical protein